MVHQDVKNVWNHLFTPKLNAKTNAIYRIKTIAQNISVGTVVNALIETINLQRKLVNTAYARFIMEVSFSVDDLVTLTDSSVICIWKVLFAKEQDLATTIEHVSMVESVSENHHTMRMNQRAVKEWRKKYAP